MRITKKQIDEIIAFDAKARRSGEFDARPTGTMSAGLPEDTRRYKANAPFPISANSMIPEQYKSEIPKTVKCLRYNYIVPDATKDPKKRDVTICHVAVRLHRKTRKPTVKVVAFTRLSDLDKKDGKLCIYYRDLGYHWMAGWQVYWDRSDFEQKAINAWIVSGAEGEGSRVKYKYGIGLTFPWHETVNVEALKGTRYEYCQYDDKECLRGLLDWLVLYRKEPKVELLAKAGLQRMVTPKGLESLGNAKVFDFVRKHMKEIAASCSTVREIIYAAKHGVSLKVADKHFAFMNELKGHLPRRYKYNPDQKGMSFRLDYERVRKTINKWGVSVSEYARYIDEAIDYGLDMKNFGTLYPPVRDGRKTFMERLERLEAENEKRRKREERRRRREERRRMALAEEEERKREAEERAFVRRTMASRLKEIAAFQKGVNRIKKIKTAGCTIVLAKSQAELRQEGRKMDNCVGMGQYGRGIVNGDTLILMFRDKKGKSWCDAEIDRSNWKVRQVYAKGNEIAPKEIADLAKQIAGELRSMHRKHVQSKKFPELLKKKVA